VDVPGNAGMTRTEAEASERGREGGREGGRKRRRGGGEAGRK